MPNLSARELSLASVAVFLAACHGGSASAGEGAGVGNLSNLGLPVGHVEGDGALLVIGVSEPDENGLVDMNFDGDTLDESAFAFDVEHGTGVNLFAALSAGFAHPITVRGTLAALAVPEHDQGQRDLNGDGDTDDIVLLVYDSASGPVLLEPHLALANVRPVIAGEFVACAVSENGQGATDLNGDGDLSDTLPYVFDSATGAVHGAGLALTSGLWLHDGWLGFTTDEAQLGADLNGDGDAFDAQVLQFLECATGAVVNSGLAGEATPVAEGSAWAVSVDEAAQALDLDGDGAQSNFVAEIYSPVTRQVTNLGLSCNTRPPLSEGARFCFFAFEHPGLDRNGDGDFLDLTPVVYDTLTSGLFEVPLAIDDSVPFASWSGDLLALDVLESVQGADLDGDGDEFDLVAHVVDLAAGSVQNLRLDVVLVTSAPDLVLLTRYEFGAGADWNHDGDQQDFVLFVHDRRSGRTRNTAVACTGAPLDVTAEQILLAVPELGDGRDWNGDGDRSDLVYVRYDVARQRIVSSKLAGSDPPRGHFLAGGRAVVLVDEAGQATDLDQDGDRLDTVPFVIE